VYQSPDHSTWCCNFHHCERVRCWVQADRQHRCAYKYVRVSSTDRRQHALINDCPGTTLAISQTRRRLGCGLRRTTASWLVYHSNIITYDNSTSTEKDCQACKPNKEDATDRSRWRKLINDVRWSGWVWVGEFFFSYRPTQVDMDKGPLNGYVYVWGKPLSRQRVIPWNFPQLSTALLPMLF